MTLVVSGRKVHIQTQYVVICRRKSDEFQLILDCEFEGKRRRSVDDIPWFGY